MAVVRVENLHKTFPIRHSRDVVTAIKEVSFEVAQGETLGLVGESGSGKTTIGRCLLRLIEPTSGRIYVGDTDITRLPESRFRPLRAKLQPVFQDPFDSLDPKLSAGQNIEEGLLLHANLGRNERWDRVRELAKQVQLEERDLFSYPRQMAGGQQQKVGIARALSTGPDFIVLDEPTSSLDPIARGEILELLLKLQRELGIAYLFISHDLTTVRYISRRVAIMYLGEIVEIGPTDEIFTQPLHPYTRALLSSTLFPDPTLGRSSFVLKGEIPSPINLPKGCYLASRCPIAEPRCHREHPPLVEIESGRDASCFRVDEMRKMAPLFPSSRLLKGRTGCEH